MDLLDINLYIGLLSISLPIYAIFMDSFFPILFNYQTTQFTTVHSFTFYGNGYFAIKK